MEIDKQFDPTSGGWKLSAKHARRKLKALLWYSPKIDRYLLCGDINRRAISQSALFALFERFANNPDAFDRGDPPTAGEVCLPIPDGIEIAELWEVPRCRGRKDRERALSWNESKMKKYGRASKPWYNRWAGAV